MVQTKCVWLDCDPGHDDVFAIILAGHSQPSIHLLGISCVAGNQTVERTTDNALRTVDFYGLRRDIPVVKGQSRPLLRPAPRLCPEIHGDSGLDNMDGKHTLPPLAHDMTAIEDEKAVNYMFSSISKAFSERQERVTVIATGALTNVALLLIVYPEARDMIDIVFMGGALGVGNTGPVSEFNIQCDPHAAQIVISSGVDVTMVPLEVTHTALCDSQVIERIRSIDPSSKLIQTTIELLTFFADRYQQVFQFEHPPLHDPCAVAYVLAPEAFNVRRLRVDVELVNEVSAGQTIVDIWKQSAREENVNVCMAMDVDAFWNMMIESIQKSYIHTKENFI